MEGKIKRSGIFFDTTVEEGSENPPTSNAVAEMIKNLDLSEIPIIKDTIDEMKEQITDLQSDDVFELNTVKKTNKKWVDGKDIYKAVFNFLQSGASWINAQSVEFFGGIDRIISVQVSRVVNGSNTVVYNGNTEIRIYNDFLQINTQADNNTSTDVCILYYTKP